eukprot:11912935-Heterocapsa_arctica.AAC.1
MQFSDGDNFITDKSCIRLLYCNKGTWGDQPNHYDLLLPMVSTVKPVNTFVTKHRDDIEPKQIM